MHNRLFRDSRKQITLDNAGYADELIRLNIVDYIRDTTVCEALINEIKPWLVEEWCIPKVGADFVAKIEDVLDVYQKPYDPQNPAACIDEPNKQMVKETRIPCEPGHPEKVDSICTRNGVMDIFMISESLRVKER